MGKRLVIAVDPGFDGCKIVINKRCYNIPFMVEDITDDVDNFSLARFGNDFIRVEYDNKTYLVGEYARKALLEKEQREKSKADLDMNFSINRFNTEKFKVGFKAFLGYALYRFCQEDEKFELNNINDYDIFLGVALPHEYSDQVWDNSVRECAAGKYKFKLIVSNDKPIDIDFNIKVENCFHNSQTISALSSKILDDDGNSVDDGKNIFDYLPALIIDGGYLTLGIINLTKSGKMVKSESNQTYAMHNINEMVANEIRSKKPDFMSYMVEEYVNSNEVLRYKDTDNEFQKFDVVELKKKYTANMATQLFDYLNKQFDDLLDIKYILVAGGTGKAYYEVFKNLCDKRENLKDNLYLADNGFNGEPCEPVFAVAIGLYKSIVPLTITTDEE